MANIPALKAELLAVLSNTANLTATEKQKLRNRFITSYPTLWQEYLAGGGTDTAANRASFAIDRTFDFWNEVYRSGSQRENVAALPQPEVMG
jgi:hypothetical protein